MQPSTTRPPIEVHARPGLMLGMPPQDFLRDFWQKHPLLIRGAFADFQCPLTPEDLAGLACEDAALSRLVIHEPRGDRWTLRHGPFAESEFPKMGARDWTLLVQDVDKWDADVRALLDGFDFIPRWRIDDVMVSYAAPGGSVGAHVDQYDVFLLQGLGTRRWQIDDRTRGRRRRTPAAGAAAHDPLACRDDTELKLLREFHPTHTWTLATGDMLYLPPGVPHHGVAVDACLTFSVGMRAPSHAELLTDFADQRALALPESARFADPDLQPADDPLEVDAAALARVRRALSGLLADDAALAAWFTTFVSRYRSVGVAAPPKPPTAAVVHKALATGGALLRHPFARAAWVRQGGSALLCVDGKSWPMGAASAAALAAAARIDATGFEALDEPARQALLALVQAGVFVLQKPARRRR